MKNSVLYVIIVFFFTSCNSIYIPNNSMPKDFQGGNEAFGSLHLGLNGVNLNAAYSPVNHIYVHGSFTKIRFLEKIFPQIDNLDFSESYQFGLGFFHNFDFLYLETEFGINNGDFDIYIASEVFSGYFKGIYSNIYNLTSISTPISDEIKFGFGIKTGYNTFNFENYRYDNKIFENKKFKNTFQLEAFMNFKYKINSYLYFYNYIGLYAPQLKVPFRVFQFRIGLTLNLRR